MNKILKGALCVGLCCTLLSAVGCKKSALDSETRVLNLATGALDGNFNPFFYTSQNDGNMISMTQISMLTTDEKGNLVAGEDWPTVVLDYTQTMYDSKGQITGSGDTEGTTEYQFLIKNGIKFSDGVDLTIKDVLFNLYVYLDPAYTGSATIYSTDIQGLNAYRAQDPKLTDSSDVTIGSEWTSEAQTRILKLIKYSTDNDPLDAQGTADLETVKKLFLEEAESDWTTVYSNFPESYKNAYRFEYAWQAYLYEEGLVQIQTKLNENGSYSQLYEDLSGDGERQDGELYYTTLDPYQTGVDAGTVGSAHLIETVNQATTADKIADYLKDNPNSTEEYAIEELQRQACVKMVYDNYTDKSKIAEILTYWGTASNALEAFTGEARTAYYDSIRDNNNGELLVKTISGITTETVTTFNGVSLGEEHSVLKIVINGVDPKAIWNFSFGVAPLHYYSGEFNGVDYVAEANGVDKFGVCEGSSDFFDQVLKSTEKQGLPVGAGAYQATDINGSDNPTRYGFKSNNIVYFKRNEYFNTVGTGIENAKIKLVNYKVYSDDKIMNALITGEIDYGMPNATPTNVNTVSDTSFLREVDYPTGGYGYIGVNPKFIPEYPIRQAIMKAMNTNMTLGYYGTSLAESIYRPMSKTSWAYPDGVEAYPDVAYTTDDSEITSLVESAGYTLVGGVYTKTSTVLGMANAAIGTKLKFTFTLAGESVDHPAYSMFKAAETRLNSLGFDITTTNSSTALQDMAMGNLAVWAAAWSSASDPDMYQVYHKDSKATSVNNWNYPNILSDSTGQWSYELSVINDLSTKIDEARQTLDQNTRADIYAQCLDLVMQLAVELPTYQRNDMCVYNVNVIDANSLVQNPSYNMGLFDLIWEIDYV